MSAETDAVFRRFHERLKQSERLQAMEAAATTEVRERLGAEIDRLRAQVATLEVRLAEVTEDLSAERDAREAGRHLRENDQARLAEAERVLAQIRRVTPRADVLGES